MGQHSAPGRGPAQGAAVFPQPAGEDPIGRLPQAALDLPTAQQAVAAAGIELLHQQRTHPEQAAVHPAAAPELAAAEQGEQSGTDQGDAQGTGGGLEAGQEGGTAAQYGQPEAHSAQTEPGAVFFPGIVVPGSGIGGGGEGRLHGGGSFLRRTAGLVLIL